jgi:uncharacterized protein YjbI with pentapeptide repeats
MRHPVRLGRLLSLLLLGGPALSGCLSEREKTVRRLLETRECEGCDLTDASLEGANLEGARLKGAKLQGARLARARLRNLRGAVHSQASPLSVTHPRPQGTHALRGV